MSHIQNVSTRLLGLAQQVRTPLASKNQIESLQSQLNSISHQIHQGHFGRFLEETLQDLSARLIEQEHGFDLERIQAEAELLSHGVGGRKRAHALRQKIFELKEGYRPSLAELRALSWAEDVADFALIGGIECKEELPEEMEEPLDPEAYEDFFKIGECVFAGKKEEAESLFRHLAPSQKALLEGKVLFDDQVATLQALIDAANRSVGNLAAYPSREEAFSLFEEASSYAEEEKI